MSTDKNKNRLVEQEEWRKGKNLGAVDNSE